MSPDLEIVIDSVCTGCLFEFVCWSKDLELFFGSEICIDYNFCSKNFIVGFDAPDDVSELLTL